MIRGQSFILRHDDDDDDDNLPKTTSVPQRRKPPVDRCKLSIDTYIHILSLLRPLITPSQHEVLLDGQQKLIINYNDYTGFEQKRFHDKQA